MYMLEGVEGSLVVSYLSESVKDMSRRGSYM